jgi:hypothetical protein
MAQQILTQFQEHPDAWQRVPAILQQAANAQTKVSRLAYRSSCRRAHSNLAFLPSVVHRSSDSRKAHHDAVEGAAGRPARRSVGCHLSSVERALCVVRADLSSSAYFQASATSSLASSSRSRRTRRHCAGKRCTSTS